MPGSVQVAGVDALKNLRVSDLVPNCGARELLPLSCLGVKLEETRGLLIQVLVDLLGDFHFHVLREIKTVSTFTTPGNYILTRDKRIFLTLESACWYLST
jgi:hypothetical protein